MLITKFLAQVKQKTPIRVLELNCSTGIRGMRLACQYPDDVERIVMVDSYLRGSELYKINSKLNRDFEEEIQEKLSCN